MRIILITFCMLSFACTKQPSETCYSAALEAANKNVLCTQDCPGVCGCDGNTYCNSCIAASHGITEVTDGPCN